MMAGSIKVRTGIEEGVASVRALIRHPMETGRRKDDLTGETVPAHYIETLTCRHNDKVVLTCQWGTGIAKNPYLAFSFTGAKAGDRLAFAWVDNRGERDALEVELK